MENGEKIRCSWVNCSNPLYVAYHDREWGRPCRNDRKLFEMLMLEMFQGGLSWECVLNKRENFRRAFDGFDPETVSRYDGQKLEALCADPGLIRHRQKLRAVISNAGVYLDILQEQGSFYAFLEQIRHREQADADLAGALAAELKKRGMKFIGPGAAESFLQAIGILDGHEPDCFLARSAGSPK